MAHDTTINAMTGGDVITTYDLSAGGAFPTTGKVPAGVLMVGAASSSTTPTPVTLANGLPVQPGTSTSWAVTAASLPLPTGAATEAKQPALGTAGTPSADVITVQGVTSMTALKVDGSAVTQPVSQVAATTGGYTPSHRISTADTNAANIKASAGTLGAFHGANNSSSNWAYVKFYNTAGTPTAGSGTPVLVIGLPPSGGANMSIPAAFGTGIGITITGGAADNDTTALAAAQVVLSLWTA